MSFSVRAQQIYKILKVCPHPDTSKTWLSYSAQRNGRGNIVSPRVHRAQINDKQDEYAWKKQLCSLICLCRFYIFLYRFWKEKS